MVGLPGAGKTTAALAICKVTGAVHIWADEHRKTKFTTPKFDQAENMSLYEQLNSEVAILLGQGNSVVFDTAFNHLSDRDHLRQIAQAHGAKTLVVWVQTASELARTRATKDTAAQTTRILGDMTNEHFDTLENKLETPTENEQPIVLDGTKITPEYISLSLGL